MCRAKQVLMSLIFLVFGGGHVAAATSSVVETITFDATLSGGTLLCGEYVGLEGPCPDRFGTVAGAFGEALMFGKAMGETYAGRIEIGFDADKIVALTCSIGGANCLFSDELLQGSFPLGDDARLDFSSYSYVLSVFDFTGDTGSYFFATDYRYEEGGVYYYSDVEFELANVTRELANVPLSGSVGFLALALGGIAFASRRKRTIDA